jgi:hypothetical protein
VAVPGWHRTEPDDYPADPWLSLLVNFTSFLVVVVGGTAAIFAFAYARRGWIWVPYVLIVGGLVAVNAALRGIRRLKRRRNRWVVRPPGSPHVWP